MAGTYIKYEKPRNAKKVLDDITDRIVLNDLDLFFINKVFKVVREWDGKPINKRIISKLEKDPQLAGWNVVYNTNYGMFHIDIFNYSHKFSALICYNNNPVIDFEAVFEHNRCHTLNEGRNGQLEQGKKKVNELTQRWNAAIAELKAINEEAEKYELGYVFEIGRDK